PPSISLQERDQNACGHASHAGTQSRSTVAGVGGMSYNSAPSGCPWRGFRAAAAGNFRKPLNPFRGFSWQGRCPHVPLLHITEKFSMAPSATRKSVAAAKKSSAAKKSKPKPKPKPVVNARAKAKPAPARKSKITLPVKAKAAAKKTKHVVRPAAKPAGRGGKPKGVVRKLMQKVVSKVKAATSGRGTPVRKPVKAAKPMRTAPKKAVPVNKKKTPIKVSPARRPPAKKTAPAKKPVSAARKPLVAAKQATTTRKIGGRTVVVSRKEVVKPVVAAKPGKSAASKAGRVAAPATPVQAPKVATPARPVARRVSSGNKAVAFVKDSGNKSKIKGKLLPPDPPMRKIERIDLSNVVLPAGYRPGPKDEYMGARQLEYFRRKLVSWREELVEESKQTIENLREEVRDVGDEAERATRETENSLELRTRDRYRKLISKIDEGLKRIEEGDYGYCVDTGEEIGTERLEARPTAERTLDAQERWEHRQRQMGD
ncbi:MAG: RNA polymerase-binding protein DksA, partial [Lysobacterales bacterium]